jgi:hypothetical protein
VADRPLTLLQLLAALNARLITAPDSPGHPCPTCGVLTAPSVTTGGPTLCYPCTVAELPGTPADNEVRIENHMTWGQYWGRVERFGTVWQNPKAWATPKGRQRR